MPSSTAPDQLLAGDLLLRVELEEGAHEVSTHDRLLSLRGYRVTAGPKKNVGVTHVAERPFSCAKVYTRMGGRTSGPLDGPGAGQAGPAARIARRDVVLEDVDELGDEAVAAQRPIELAVDEDRRDRLLERARQARCRCRRACSRPGR